MIFWSAVLVVVAILLGLAWRYDRRRSGQVGDIEGRTWKSRAITRGTVQQYDAPRGGEGGIGGGGPTG